MIRVPISTLVRSLGVAALCAAVIAPVFAANQTLLVFPVDKPEAVDQGVADAVLSGLRSRVAGPVKYDAMAFSPTSALAKMAVTGGTLTAAQVAGPYTPETASAIARAVGADMALVASVEDASVDTAANKATVTISAQLLGALDGKAVKTAGASGEAVNASSPQLSLLRQAADAAAGKAAAQLFGASANAPGPVVRPQPGKTPGATSEGAVPTPPAAKKSKKGGKTGLLIGGLILVGVIIASSHGSSGGGTNTGGGGPPPFPF
ncbi:MAG TPA: hypothetical protein VGM51_12600 [Armatimonadota bacterium]|jgi:hypothetical protein